MSSKKNLIPEFLTNLDSAKKKNQRSYYFHGWDSDKCISALLKYSEADIKSIVSSSYWNRYPTWSSSTAKVYGPAIMQILRAASKSYPRLLSYVATHGSGIWLCYAIDYSSGKDRLKAAKRGIKSSDSRVRLRSARVIPTSALKKHLGDKNDSVRRIVTSRLGIENCYKHLLDSKDSWTRLQAVRAAPLEEFDYDGIIAKALENNGYISWRDKSMITSIVSRMDKKDLLYALDIVRDNDELTDIVNKRLSSSWG
jgi:hypothetical protein